ncbi:MAG: hypothetical protein QNJ84_12065 [Alphaproteobacteria bacterium]|nr:hypothetical protein [Alphaproteobacteria bacterium]
MRQLLKTTGAAAVVALGAAGALSSAHAAGKAVTVTGEIMDTWCYFSGVMGGPEATLGAAHHTCAMWCAAGGVPVGLRTDEGEVYMVLQMENVSMADGSEAVLEVQSDMITASGMAYERDGLNYIVIEKVVENMGITNLSHEEYGLTPGFAIPKGAKKRILGQ